MPASRFQVPPFLTFDGDDQRVLLTIGAQLHAIAGRPGGPDLPTCRRYTVKMYESTGREWHDSGGVLVPVRRHHRVGSVADWNAWKADQNPAALAALVEDLRAYARFDGEDGARRELPTR